MATAGTPYPDPNQPWLQAPQGSPFQYNPYPYGGFDPNANGGKGNGSDTSQMGFAPAGNEADVNPNASMEDIYAANRDTINTTGNALGSEGGNEFNYYGAQTVQDQQAQNNALNQLQQTPGYTADQTSAIMGDPNAPVATLNAGIDNQKAALNQYGQNASAQVAQTEGWEGGAADQFKAGVGGAATDYGTGVGGAASNYGTGVGGAASAYGTGVNGAVSGLQSGLTGAQSKFSPLDTAVNNPALGFDPNSTEKQMSDQDVQNMVTAAGTTVGNQFQTAEDTLERQAAAAGNTSPAALAAMRQQLVTQEAATAGDTMTNAQIAAQQAQYGRAQGIEQQREGAVDTQTGLKATAATTEEAAAQAAAGTAGQSAIAAQENIGGANLSAQQAIGQANIGAQENIGGANLTAQQAIGANTQATANNVSQQALNEANTYGQFDVGQQNTQTGQQYGAGSTAEQLAATRAGTVANQSIAGQTAYRSGVAGQQQLAQQGQGTAQQTQTSAYGTQTAGANAAASGQGNFEVGKPSFGDTLGKDTAGSIAALFADGGVADHDMIAKVGEAGPEWVGNINALQREGVRGSRYGGSRKRREDPEMFGIAA